MPNKYQDEKDLLKLYNNRVLARQRINYHKE